MTLLEDIGAVDGQQRLTRMGRHLAALPLSPRVGKLLLLSVLFQCLDPMLTVACGERLLHGPYHQPRPFPLHRRLPWCIQGPYHLDNCLAPVSVAIDRDIRP